MVPPEMDYGIWLLATTLTFATASLLHFALIFLGFSPIYLAQLENYGFS